MNTIFNLDDVVFTTDTHYGHANIIKYSQRPFYTEYVNDMDRVMLEGFQEADAVNKTVFHLGDFVFNDTYITNQSWRPTNKHVIVLGNHDKYANIGGKKRKLYRQYFSRIVGHSNQWKINHLNIDVGGTKLILSHEPQQNLCGADYNLYGHHHNNMFTNPEFFKKQYPWLFGSKKHINVSVELTNYKPVSLADALNLPTV